MRRYDYPRHGREQQKIPNQSDIEKLCQQFPRWGAELGIRMILQGAMRAGEVLGLEKQNITEKEESIEVYITEGLGRRNIEIAKTPRMEILLEKAFQTDQDTLIPLDLNSFQAKVREAREKAGDSIPEEVSVRLHALRGSGICGMIEDGFSRSEIESYTGSNKSSFIRGLFRQKEEELFPQHKGWKDKSAVILKRHGIEQENSAIKKEQLDQLIKQETGGRYKNLQQLISRVSSREEDTCNFCGYFSNPEERQNRESGKGRCPECGRTQEVKN